MRIVATRELQGWFKAKVASAEWVSDGIVAVRVTDAAAPKMADVAAILRSTETPGSRASLPNGYDRIGDTVFNRHLLDFIEAAYPGCSWRVSAYGCAVAVVDNERVGIVMRVQGDPVDAKNMGPANAPDCAACDGNGGYVNCEKCDGSGEIDHVCGCGDEHTAECKSCKGYGWKKRCTVCGGTGDWKPEHDAERGAA